MTSWYVNKFNHSNPSKLNVNHGLQIFNYRNIENSCNTNVPDLKVLHTFIGN